MNTIDILRHNSLDLPLEHDINTNIRNLLIKKFEDYICEFKMYEELRDVFQDFENYKQKIFLSLDSYYNGDIKNSYSYIESILNEISSSILYISDFCKKHILSDIYYKARKVQDCNETISSREEMFHIPFEKRYLVGNQRYSISGFPCIYLGATTYTCWEELGCPSNDLLYFVKFKIPENYNIVTIGLLPYELKDFILRNKINDDLLIKHYLRMLPIIIACSIQVPIDRKVATFKEEYIIPQLLTQWLLSSADFDAISYFSTAAITRSRKNNKLYQNLVIPIKQSSDTGYCSKLVQELQLTEPIHTNDIDFFNEEYPYLPSTNNSKNNGIGMITNRLENLTIHYSGSGFRYLEKLLDQKQYGAIKNY